MKKILFWVFTSIQVLLFIGIFVLESLSHQHMTLMRIILYKKRLWETELPIDSMLLYTKFILIAITLFAIFFLIIIFIKNRSFDFYGNLQLFTLAMLTAGSAFFIALNNTDSFGTYYFAIMLLLIITAIQLIKIPFFIKNLKAV